MTFSVDEYNRAEAEELAQSGYAQYSSVSTKTFRDHGFPTNIENESELFRYVDNVVGVDLRCLEPGHLFRDTPVQTDYSMEEIVVLNKVAQHVEQLTEKLCEKSCSVFFNHLSAMGLVRVVQAIARNTHTDKLSIFEVGPGCGYAGAMLGLGGHRYASYDVTQGYYIWQNRLFDHMFSGEFADYATASEIGGEIPRLSHFPWWHYLKFHQRCPINCDVVISNANLAEMHPLSLKYVLRVSKLMLENSDIGMFVFGDIGARHQNNRDGIFAELDLAGFEPLCNRLFYGFKLKGREFPSELIASLESNEAILNVDGSTKSFGAQDFLSFDHDKLSDEFQFYSFLSDWPISR